MGIHWAGVKIDGINENIVGAAPDIGAHEFGDDKWNAGSSISISEFRD